MIELIVVFAALGCVLGLLLNLPGCPNCGRKGCPSYIGEPFTRK